jgi:hypothetical protein
LNQSERYAIPAKLRRGFSFLAVAKAGRARSPLVGARRQASEEIAVEKVEAAC